MHHDGCPLPEAFHIHEPADGCRPHPGAVEVRRVLGGESVGRGRPEHHRAGVEPRSSSLPVRRDDPSSATVRQDVVVGQGRGCRDPNDSWRAGRPNDGLGITRSESHASVCTGLSSPGRPGLDRLAGRLLGSEPGVCPCSRHRGRTPDGCSDEYRPEMLPLTPIKATASLPIACAAEGARDVPFALALWVSRRHHLPGRIEGRLGEGSRGPGPAPNSFHDGAVLLRAFAHRAPSGTCGVPVQPCGAAGCRAARR
jgi:hypothetical protein